MPQLLPLQCLLTAEPTIATLRNAGLRVVPKVRGVHLVYALPMVEAKDARSQDAIRGQKVEQPIARHMVVAADVSS